MADGRLLSVSTPRQTFADLHLPLYGAHQAANCALALAAATAFVAQPLDDGATRHGLAAVRMPARMETVLASPRVILDGAHNPDAARALARALHDDIPARGRRILIIGLLAGRDPAAMLDAIEAHKFDEIIACTAPTARARAAAEIAAAAAELGCHVREVPDVADALRTAIAHSGPDDQIVVTGSIYLVAEARASLSR
ncbi:MAG TPA: cyanophycin synthetase [Ilumatobacteraceae bacterium]